METLDFICCIVLAVLFFEGSFLLIKKLSKPEPQNFTKLPDGDYYLGAESSEYDQIVYDEQIYR